MAIQKYGSKLLRRVSRLVHDEFPLRDYVQMMFNNIDTEGYSGISCPQVGETRRIIVINLDGVRQEFVNPKIISRGGDIVKKVETCPSLPGIEVEVERFDEIIIRYYDKEWNEYSRKFSGDISREIQKNYDILDGVLIIDHLDQVELRKLGTTLNMLSMGMDSSGRSIYGGSRNPFGGRTMRRVVSSSVISSLNVNDENSVFYDETDTEL